MISRSLFRYTIAILATPHLRKVSHRIPRDVVQTPQNLSQLHTSAPLSAKLFVDKENQYAHDILRHANLYKLSEGFGVTLPEIPRTEEIEDLLCPEKSRSPSDILNDFKKIAQFCKSTETCITEERFDKFVEVFEEKCRHFSDEALRESLRYLSLFPPTSGINARNFVKVWSALDAACFDRIEKWSIEELLLMSDYWYALSLARPSEFVWEVLRKIGRKVKRLSPQQMVHTMFLCNVVRKSLFDMFDFEVRLDQCIEELSLKEIGIMSMGFFKTQTPIRNPELIEKIYRRLLAELDTVEDITLVNILKVLRYSSKIPQAAVMNELLEKICPQIERVSLLACLHIALLGTDIQLFHPKSIELILERFNKEIDECRLKDMERIALVISQANLCENNSTARELCEKILVKIKDKIDEIIRHPKCFMNCLNFLVICGYYDEDLLSGALEEKFLAHTYKGNYLLAREAFQLDSFVRISLKGRYKGHQLSEKTRKRMGKVLSNYFPDRKYRLHATDRVLLEVKESCDQVYRTSHLKHVLPHFQRADVVISYDKRLKQALPLSKSCPEDFTGAILFRDLIVEEDVEDISTIIIVVGGWSNYIRDTNKPTGLFRLKLEQLKLLKHKVLVIPWFEWRVLETVTDKHDYLKRKISPLLY